MAHIASQYLSQLNFSGITVDELMGRNDYSMKDFSVKLGIPYKQVEAPEEFASFFDAFNSGNYKVVKRTSVNTSIFRQEKFSLEYFLSNCFDKALIE